MAKTKSQYVCTECGSISVKWVGKCPDCGAWNTMEEHLIEKSNPHTARSLSSGKVEKLIDITDDKNVRTTTGINELNRVLGGGIVKGCLTLVGGDPGIGKSTLLLQVAGNLSQDNNVLYISGEESLHQVGLRAARLNVKDKDVNLCCETNVNKIIAAADELNANIMIVDSIQTMYRDDIVSAPGSVSQVRECAAMYMRYAKENDCAVFLVGHVTKQGSIAGPRILEHMVDTVLYFEGGANHTYRILRAVKNRFGSTNEIGVFEMCDDGMKEVKNPSEMLLAERSEGFPGSAVTITLEGTRPLLIEVQSLISQTSFGSPRRQASGMDYNRVVLLLAVLEKRTGLQLYDKDCYVNIAGGLKIAEPASDLGLCLAVASAAKNKIVPGDIAVFGEVGLTGEVRSVTQPQLRINEAARSGFKRIILPGKSIKGLKVKDGVELIPVERLGQALQCVFD